jgi:hypothetical protein
VRTVLALVLLAFAGNVPAQQPQKMFVMFMCPTAKACNLQGDTAVSGTPLAVELGGYGQCSLHAAKNLLDTQKGARGTPHEAASLALTDRCLQVVHTDTTPGPEYDPAAPATLYMPLLTLSDYMRLPPIQGNIPLSAVLLFMSKNRCEQALVPLATPAGGKWVCAPIETIVRGGTP